MNASMNLERLKHVIRKLRGNRSRAERRNRHLGMDLRSIEWQAIVWALEDSSGNRAQAAKALGISERTLYRRLANDRRKVR